MLMHCAPPSRVNRVDLVLGGDEQSNRSEVVDVGVDEAAAGGASNRRTANAVAALLVRTKKKKKGYNCFAVC